MSTLVNGLANRPASMGDAISGKVFAGTRLAGDNGNFDLKRLQGKICVAYCDGHAEARDITIKSLLNVWIVAP